MDCTVSLAEDSWLVDRYRVRFDSARSGKERNSGSERCTVSAYSFVLVRSSGHQRFDWEHRAAGSHSRCTLAEARRIHVPVDSWPSFARQFARQFDLLPKALVAQYGLAGRDAVLPWLRAEAARLRSDITSKVPFPCD